MLYIKAKVCNLCNTERLVETVSPCVAGLDLSGKSNYRLILRSINQCVLHYLSHTLIYFSNIYLLQMKIVRVSTNRAVVEGKQFDCNFVHAFIFFSFSFHFKK